MPQNRAKVRIHYSVGRNDNGTWYINRYISIGEGNDASRSTPYDQMEESEAHKLVEVLNKYTEFEEANMVWGIA